MTAGYQTLRQRTYPHGALNLCALDQDRWTRVFDSSQRVAVYWPVAADSVTIVGYYSTVSAANTAATANVNAAGVKPKVAINWSHSSITHIEIGAVLHPDARTTQPAWIDAEPGA